MLGAQCGVARAILDLTLDQLAEKAGVALDAILRLEAGAPVEVEAAARIEAAFAAEGIEMTYGERPGVRLKTLDGIIEVSAGLPQKPV